MNSNIETIIAQFRIMLFIGFEGVHFVKILICRFKKNATRIYIVGNNI